MTRIALIQAKCYKVIKKKEALEAIEIMIILSAGVLLALFLVFIMTRYITGNSEDSIKTKSQSGVSDIFNVD